MAPDLPDRGPRGTGACQQSQLPVDSVSLVARARHSGRWERPPAVWDLRVPSSNSASGPRRVGKLNHSDSGDRWVFVNPG